MLLRSKEQFLDEVVDQPVLLQHDPGVRLGDVVRHDLPEDLQIRTLDDHALLLLDGAVTSSITAFVVRFRREQTTGLNCQEPMMRHSFAANQKPAIRVELDLCSPGTHSLTT